MVCNLQFSLILIAGASKMAAARDDIGLENQKISYDDLCRMRVVDLKKFLSKVGQPVGGNKMDLIIRILDFQDQLIFSSPRSDTPEVIEPSIVESRVSSTDHRSLLMEIEITRLETKLEIARLEQELLRSKNSTSKGRSNRVFSSTRIPAPIHVDPIPRVDSILTTHPAIMTARPAPVSSPSPIVPQANLRNLPQSTGVSSSSGSGSYSEADRVFQLISDNMARSSLPTPAPSVFSGDPLQFHKWNQDFGALLNRVPSLTDSDKMYYLTKHLGGEALLTIEGFESAEDSETYPLAKRLIDERFGDPFIVAEAYKSKLKGWEKITASDDFGLRHLSDYLGKCLSAKRYLPGLSILDDTSINQQILSILPDHIISMWNSKVQSSRKAGSGFPSFEVFVQFLKSESEKATDSVTSLGAIKRLRKGKVVNVTHATFKSSSGGASGSQVSTSQSVATGSQSSCLVCLESHLVYQCPKFKALSESDRIAKAKFLRLCFRCLRTGHMAGQCERNLSCRKCKLDHNSLLHLPVELKSEVSSKHTETANCSKVQMNGGQNHTRLSSMIVPVWVSSQSNARDERLVYALLDSQSDATFVTSSVVDSVKAKTYDTQLCMSTMTSRNQKITCKKAVDLVVRGYGSKEMISLPGSYAREFIPHNPEHLPTSEFASSWDHLKHIAHEFPVLNNCPVGLLIGFNCSQALLPVEVIRGADSEPYAMRTPLGWSMVGGMTCGSDEEVDDIGYSHRITCHDVPVELKSEATPFPNCLLSDGVTVVHRNQCVEQCFDAAEVLRLLEGDFCLNGDSSLDAASHEDQQFLNILRGTIHQDSEGYYTMPLPFRSERVTLEGNRGQAVKRFQSLEKRLCQDNNLRDLYHQFMQELISSGHAEVVPNSDIVADEVWYLPHHGVINPFKPGKVRVVFDASCKFKGRSLNQCLLSGPDLNNSLVGVLTRFRQKQVAVSCDIAKMFHQFKVSKQHRDFLRFLWYGTDGSSVVDYRMTVHIFGSTSSPNCAKFGLTKLADDHSSVYPRAASFIRRNFYVDDGLASVDSVPEAIRLLDETRSVCSKGNLKLHKLLSNHPEVLQSFPKEDWAGDLSVLSKFDTSSQVEKMLGVQWSVDSDEFVFVPRSKALNLTRRGVLSALASLFDPLGFLAPYVLVGKLIMQHCCNGLEWDEVLPEATKCQWTSWVSQISELDSFVMSRCYVPAQFKRIVVQEIHVFADASESAYGACCYLRSVDESGAVWCSFLFGKSRVVPLRKRQTIPRLELQAAVLAVKLGCRMQQELDFDTQLVCYTDSQIVLGYIANEVKRFQTYVANRVNQIRELSKVNQWLHVSGETNPADMASRGCTVKQLVSSRWLKGPEFLWVSELSTEVTRFSVAEDDPEVKTAKVVNRVMSSMECNLLQYVEKFSTWKSLLRFITILYNVVKLRFKVDFSVLIHQKAEQWLLLSAQLASFPQEYQDLLDGNLVQKSSSLWRLDPFIDDVGLIRVGGRLKRSSLDEELKYPIVLTGKSHLAVLLIRHFHAKIGHQGRTSVLAAIRSSGYWLVGGRSMVSSLIHRCVICRYMRRPNEQQKMADLPTDRTEPQAPFTYSGCDCFGPIMVKDGRKTLKKYGLIFTCLASRAVHLELLDDLSQDAFLNSVRCFFAIRGNCRQLRCDKGTNFVGAAGELAKAFQELPDDDFKRRLRQNQCDFVFNPPHASHMGGVWERLIRSVKSVLQGILLESHSRLDTSSARTLLYEVMSLINSRPLSPHIYHDEKPLSPNDLLLLRSDVVLPPPGQFESADLYSRKRWRKVQYLVNAFWDKWKKVYLTSLQERGKWLQVRRNIAIGDIVLLKESSVRGDWRIGRVEEVMPSSADGLVRKAKVRMGSGVSSSILERPIAKMVVLLEAV